MSESLRERARARRLKRGWPDDDDSWDERLADRCNPVLVREIRQASHSRVLPLLLTNGGIALFIAALYSLPEPNDPNPALVARGQAENVMVGLRALLLGYLPFRAFLAMREEVTGEAREQLLLSGLDPLRVVTGRVPSSMLLASVFLGLAGPSLALCAGQRGVTIAGMLFALGALGLGSIALSAVTAGLAALTRRFEPAAVPVIGALALCFVTAAAQPDPLHNGLVPAFEEAVRLGAWGPWSASLLLATAATGLGAALAAAALRAGPRTQGGPTPLLAIAWCVAPVLGVAAWLWPAGPRWSDGVAVPASVLLVPVLAGTVLGVPGFGAVPALGAAVLGAASLELGALLAPPAANPNAAALTHTLALWLPLLTGGALLARIAPEPGEDPRVDGRGPLRFVAGLTLLALSPMLVNGLLGRTSTTWHAGQALNPLAVLPRAAAGRVDATTWIVLGSIVVVVAAAALLRARAIAPRLGAAGDDTPDAEVTA